MQQRIQHPCFFLLGLKEVGAVYGNRDLIGQRLQHEKIVFIEHTIVIALHIQHANQLRADPHWHGEFGGNIGLIGDKTWLIAHIIDQHWLAGLRHMADNAHARGQALALFAPKGIITIGTGAKNQFLRRIIHRKQMHVVIAETSANAIDHRWQQALQIQNSGDLAADFADGGELGGATTGGSVGTGFVNRNRGLVGDQRQQAQIVAVERMRRTALDRNRA